MRDATPAWAAMLRVHATLVPLLDRELRIAHDLPLNWYDVLLELDVSPDGRLTMGELGRLAVVSRSRVSRVVDDLVRAGLVRREPNPTDARSAYAIITDHGRARRRAAAPTYVDGIDRHFAGPLADDERRMIAEALRKVLAAAEVYEIQTTPRGGPSATRD